LARAGPPAMAPRPSSAGAAPASTPSSAKKGKKAPDRLSTILQRIVDDTSPVVPHDDSTGESFANHTRTLSLFGYYS